MGILLISSRLILASVFIIAGIGKLLDLDGSRRAVQEFGIPSPWARIAGSLLPIIEIGIGLALIPLVTAWWSAVGALLLLLLFVGAISVTLAEGRKPKCHCFGVFHSTPIGWSTLVRNSAFAVLAGVLAWQGPNNVGPSIVDALAILGITNGLWLSIAFILAASTLLQGWFLINLMRQNGRLLVRLEALEQGRNIPSSLAVPNRISATGLPIGTSAPAFLLPGLYGETLTLDALRASGKPLMLIFSDPNCGPCNALLATLAPLQREHSSKLTIGFISRGKVETNRKKSAEHGLQHVMLQQDNEIAEAYRVNGTPSAVIVQSDGTIGSALAIGADAIHELLTQTINLPMPFAPIIVPAHANRGCGCGNGNGQAVNNAIVATTKRGEYAPQWKLPDLSGRMIQLSAFRGKRILMLFWNPSCEFCASMLNDLRILEETMPIGAPQLLIIANGSAEDNRHMELRSPIVLDQDFGVGHSLGAEGTPSAVLLDTDGIVVSDVAVGASAVLALANTIDLDC
jgi:peroxiredoxin/uncharacterized membrane protein YphA (DoxX/SURF4 family)